MSLLPYNGAGLGRDWLWRRVPLVAILALAVLLVLLY